MAFYHSWSRAVSSLCSGARRLVLAGRGQPDGVGCAAVGGGAIALARRTACAAAPRAVYVTRYAHTTQRGQPDPCNQDRTSDRRSCLRRT